MADRCVQMNKCAELRRTDLRETQSPLMAIRPRQLVGHFKRGDYWPSITEP